MREGTHAVPLARRTGQCADSSVGTHSEAGESGDGVLSMLQQVREIQEEDGMRLVNIRE